MVEDLYRSETMLVRCIPGADESRWVVTFDNYGAGSGFDRPGFGEAFLASEGVSQISVLGHGNHWYQYADIALALTAARDRMAGADRVMTYGSSMGGYAAIRFAPALGAHCCLALSPQYSNDPARVPFEWRWRNDGAAIAWSPDVDGPIRSGVPTIVVADARREDAEHVRRIRDEIAVEVVGLAYTAHPVTTFLNAVGLLQRAIIDMVHDRFDVAAFRVDAQTRRRQSDVYLGELARLQPACRPRTAILLAKRAVALAVDSPLAHHVLGLRLAKAGDYAGALVHHNKAVEISAGSWSYALPYSEILAAVGRGEEAFAIADDLVSREPSLAPLNCWVGHLHWTQGRRAEARHHAARACALAPASRFYADNLALYHKPARQTLLRYARWVVRRLRGRARRHRYGSVARLRR